MVFFILAVAIPVVYSTLYVRDQLRHECASLELLTSQPVAKPQPGKPTSAEVYRLYQDIQLWKHEDGCG